MLIDTHVHLNFPQFKGQEIKDILNRAKNKNVDLVINIGSDYQSCLDSINIANDFTGVFASLGIHPHHADEVTEDTLTKIKNLADNKKVVAIGEVGLDYFSIDPGTNGAKMGTGTKGASPKDIQKEIFKKFITLAHELNLPLIIHDRDAHDDILEILRKATVTNGACHLKGVLHCFSGDTAFAQEILNLGFLISFTGPLTFKNGENIRKVARAIPIEKIMIETDCPFLSPEPFRGKTNEPAYVYYIAEKLAEIKNLPFEKVADITSQNAIELFNLHA